MEYHGRIRIFLNMLLLLCLTGSGFSEPDAYYRVQERDKPDCLFPKCGGYYLDKINVHEREPQYVAWIDLSHLGDDVINTVNDFVKEFGYGLVIYLGSLVPFKSPTGEPIADVQTLKVSAVYLGLPGVDVGTSILRRKFYTIDSLGDSPVVVTLNDGRPPVPLDEMLSSLTIQPVGNLDVEWQLWQLMQSRALFTAKRIRNTTVPAAINSFAVFIELPLQIGPCPMVMEVFCNEMAGKARILKRGPNLCFSSQCVDKEETFCSQGFPVCDPGYRLACWPSSPGGCKTYKCDPIFAPIASKGECSLSA